MLALFSTLVISASLHRCYTRNFYIDTPAIHRINRPCYQAFSLQACNSLVAAAELTPALWQLHQLTMFTPG